MKPDQVLVILAILLAATLLAFFTGFFPYPYGWIVLLALIGFQVSALRRKE